MKTKEVLLAVIASAIPIAVILFNVIELISVMSSNSAYPFGSDYFSKISIYQSKSVYILYNIILSAIFGTSIYLAFKKKWGLFGINLVTGFM